MASSKVMCAARVETDGCRPSEHLRGALAVAAQDTRIATQVAPKEPSRTSRIITDYRVHAAVPDESTDSRRRA